MSKEQDNDSYEACFRNNLLDYLYENRLTQADLSRLTDIDAGRISRCLSSNNNDFFQPSQLCKIAEALNISLDDLFGLKESNDTEGKELSDSEKRQRVLKLLFEIDSLTSFFIIYDQEQTPDFYQICIDDPVLNQYLKEWRDIQDIRTNKETKKKLLDIWKNDSLAKILLSDNET